MTETHEQLMDAAAYNALPHGAKLVFKVVATAADRGAAEISHLTFAERGIPVMSLRGALPILTDHLGVVVVTRQSGRGPNLYAINRERCAQLDADAVKRAAEAVKQAKAVKRTAQMRMKAG